MPEQDLNPAAAKFISSLVKSLQILCNGQVEFSESIELVGHINVRVDHKYKFDYIVDEQVSKEGEDSATTFLSNSYHSSPPSKQLRKKPSQSELDQDIMFSEISQNIHGKSRQSKVNHDSLVQSHEFCSEDTLVSGEESCPNFSVAVDSPNRQGSQTNQMVVKLEEDDDSNDCMVLPASPGDYEPVGEVIGEGFPSIGPSASFEESQSNQVGRTRKRRQPPEQGTPVDGVVSLRSMEKGMQLRLSVAETKTTSNTVDSINDSQKLTVPSDQINPVNNMKQLISRLATLCDMTVVQDELVMVASKNMVIPSEEDIKTVKKKFLESFDKEKLKKIKEILKMKKGKHKKTKIRITFS